MPPASSGATATTPAAALTPSSPSPDSRMTPGGPGYRRMSFALFLAGVAAFALLYSTQALCPGHADDFGVTAAPGEHGP
ncbi:MFS transporter OS=Streptomyces alboniger OX=132473 GN=CP975_21950 PE=3 SV=1 [Streptomyces alboniger]